MHDLIEEKKREASVCENLKVDYATGVGGIFLVQKVVVKN